MDEKQIIEIAKIIVQMMKAQEMTLDQNTSDLPTAYILLSEEWQAYDPELYEQVINSLEGQYRRILILPKEIDKSRFSQVIGCSIIARNDAAAPVENSVSFFPIPCRSLVSKTALGLDDDFESHWVRMCMEKGATVYMRKESPMFTGKEAAAYQKKILSYYREVSSYGIRFLEEQRENKKNMPGTDGMRRLQRQNKRYITVADLNNVDNTKVFRIQEGDVFTALAEERIEALGIRVVIE